MRKEKGQGSLEYLIIIAAVLAIAAIVVLFLTGAFKQTGKDVAACKQAAGSCASSLVGAPDGTQCGETVCADCIGINATVSTAGTCATACNGSECDNVTEACRYGAPQCIITG